MLLAELGLDRARIGEIQNVKVENIVAAQAAVERKLGPRLVGMRRGFVPVVDEQILEQHPFDPKASPVGADVPVMIGYNRTETTLFLAGDRQAFALDEEGLRQRVKVILRDKSEQVIEEFRAANPGATPSELFFLIGGESMMGANSRKIAQRKSEQGQAPAYLYRFDWETPVADGRLKSPHALEITFVFDHAGEPLAPRLAPDSPEVRALVADMSGRWIAFARTGDPNICSALNWPAYSAAERVTMIFNSPCRVEKDPSRQERLAIDRVLFPRRSPERTRSITDLASASRLSADCARHNPIQVVPARRQSIRLQATGARAPRFWETRRPSAKETLDTSSVANRESLSAHRGPEHVARARGFAQWLRRCPSHGFTPLPSRRQPTGAFPDASVCKSTHGKLGIALAIFSVRRTKPVSSLTSSTSEASPQDHHRKDSPTSNRGCRRAHREVRKQDAVRQCCGFSR